MTKEEREAEQLDWVKFVKSALHVVADLSDQDLGAVARTSDRPGLTAQALYVARNGIRTALKSIP